MAMTGSVSRSTSFSVFCTKCVCPFSVFAICASSYAGLFQSLFEVRFLHLRSSRTISGRVDVSIRGAFARLRSFIALPVSHTIIERIAALATSVVESKAIRIPCSRPQSTGTCNT